MDTSGETGPATWHAHANRFEGQGSWALQFFLEYYFAIIVGLGLLFFGWLWFRQWRRERRQTVN